MDSTVRRERGLFLVLLVAVACSGAAGLTYQVLWLRLLSLVFGVTAYAASTVLAGFMAGLALGSLIAGRLASRARHPLRLFAAAEVGIALAALISLPLFGELPAWYAGLYGLLGEDMATLTLARFVGAFLVLVVPTSIMGATLPLLAASALVRRRQTAAHVSAVYAANTAGAVVGAFATGMYLIGAIGVTASFFVAAAANAIAAAMAWSVSSSDASSHASTTSDAPASAADRSDAIVETAPVRRTALVVLGVSGLASLALEVIWFRILVLFIPATTYAFTTMLAAVLLGIAGGGWIAARLLVGRRDWLATLVKVQAATAVAIPLSLTVLAWTYGRGWRTSGQIQAAVVAILPAALLMGVAFPIGLRLWSRSGRESALARDVSTGYSVNVGGAIIGAILGGFVLLPGLGSQASLLVCAALYLLCAAALAYQDTSRRRALTTMACATVAFTATAAFVPDPFLATLARRHGASDRIIWREEGVQTTVSLHQQEGRRYAVFLDGLHQANDSPGMLQTHREIGHLPMVLHPRPERALVIGLGGGATSGAVSRHGSQVDIVELSSSVRRAAELFAHANYHVLAQPHVRLRVDDGRNYLLTTRERYDVITADIIQPMHAGAGLVYSAEYFALARNVLKDDGLMLQWVGHRPDRQYRLMVRAFLAAFPHTTLWQQGTLLIGSKRPLTISRSAFERHRRSPSTREALDLVGLRSFDDLTGRFVAGPAELRAFIGVGEMLTDDRPRLEFHRSLPRNDRDIDLSALLATRPPPPVSD